jgi:hypothetical protein
MSSGSNPFGATVTVARRAGKAAKISALASSLMTATPAARSRMSRSILLLSAFANRPCW